MPPPNPEPSPLTAADGLADAARRFVDASPGLGRGTDLTAVVLADVAAGALLHLSDLDPEAAGSIRDDLAGAVRTALDGGRTDGDATGAPVDPSGSSSAADGAGVHPLVALITAAHIAEYVYERASVHLPADAPARQESHSRIAGLSGITAIAPSLAENVSVPSSSPAWDVAEPPEDAQTALAAIRDAEDSLVGRLWSARSTVPPAVFLSSLNDSATRAPPRRRLPGPALRGHPADSRGGRMRGPNVLYETAREINGEHHTHAWTRALDFMVIELVDRWGLTLDPQPTSPWAGCESLVLPVLTQERRPAIIRFAAPNVDNPRVHAQILDALRAWNGRGAVQVLADDSSFRATLQERLDGDEPLSTPPGPGAGDVGDSPRRCGCPGCRVWSASRTSPQGGSIASRPTPPC